MVNEIFGVNTKKARLEKSGVQKARRAPVSLFSYHLACFANSITRCLQGTAPINSYYRRQASGVLSGVMNCEVTEGDLRSMEGNTQTICAKKALV